MPQVEIEYRNVTTYIARDGKQFESKERAMQYERSLDRKFIQVENNSSIFGEVTFYLVNSIEDILDISNPRFAKDYEKREFPFWLGIEVDEDGYQYAVTLKDLQLYAESIYLSYLEIKKAIKGDAENEETSNS